MADLGDIGNFIEQIGTTVGSVFKTVNAPSGVAVKPSGRPDGSTRPTGQTGTSLTTVLLIAAVGVLGLAFVLSLRK